MHSASRRAHVYCHRFPRDPMNIVLILGLLSISCILRAQQSPGNAQQSPNRDEQDQSVSTLKVNVDVVNLFFNVKDKRSALVPNLKRDDFQVFEDGKQQS